MFNEGDFVDLLIRHFSPARSREAAPAPAEKPARPRAAARVFLSEREIRAMLAPGSRRLEVPPGAIVSPLAQEWLALQGVDVVFTG